MQWYYSKDNKKFGPVTMSELRTLSKSGHFDSDDLVWHTGLSAWTKARNIVELHETSMNDMHEGTLSNQRALSHQGSSHGNVLLNKTPISDVNVQYTQVSSSYIRRHWDGDLSLPVSFWVNNVLLNITLIGISIGMIQLSFYEEYPVQAACGFIIFLITMLPLTAWQWVGLYRSARRCIKEEVSPSWARAAILMLILGIFGTIAQFNRNWPIYRDVVKVIFNDSITYDYKVSLANNNTEIRIDGGIGLGVSSDVQALLEQHSEIKTIHLNSVGGFIEEGRKLAKIIRENWLDTYTSEKCLSACTLAFVAGKRRVIGPDAVIGFHQYEVYESTRVTHSVEEQYDRDLMLKAGIDNEFLESAYSTPNSSMWYPTVQQLLEAGVVTATTKGTEYSKWKRADKTINKSDVADALLQIKLFNTLNKYDQLSFHKLVETIATGLQHGSSLDSIAASAQPYVYNIVFERAAYSDDMALLAFSSVLVDELTELNRQSPLLCMRSVFPESYGSVAFAPYLSESVVQREMDVMIQIIESYISTRKIPSLTDEQDAILGDALLSAADIYPGIYDIFENPQVPEAEHKSVCMAIVELYTVINRSQKEDALAILRYIFS